MSAFSELDRTIRQLAHTQAIDLPVKETIDALWQVALDVGMENGTHYAAIRNAIAWLEVLRAG